MENRSLLEKYARLAVRRGVNVQKGQPLVIRAGVDGAEFVRMCVKEAYLAGASTVTVDWRDDELTRCKYEYQTLETLQEIPDYEYQKKKYEQDHHACYLSISSAAPGNLKDIDPKKIRAYGAAYAEKMDDLDHYLMNNEGQWCVIGLPGVKWAKAVYPDLPEDEAFEKLLEAILKVSHVTRDNDPVKAWEEHDAVLIGHAKKMTDYNFEKLHFTSELGTDLYVGLVKDHIWVGGGDYTPEGVYFDPNIPTEEVFTMPEKTGVNGIVYASKPLSYNGKVIDGFWFRFKDGKIVEHGAKVEEETLTELLEFDEGSRYLGEVALVPYDSPISKMNLLFFNTLYDENAACHLAIGNPYPENLKGGNEMSPEELKAHGANSSRQHEDFMFGTKDMSVDGITYGGEVIPVFRKGNFVI